ncbi:MAG: sorting and assembly machinery component 50 [Candidatus Azobacteroides sp.]|nr:sorting and assembly machinery component 50 [Candidatus Azobacteroides sp.]
MKNFNRYCWLVIPIIWILYSCNSTKFVADGDYLLDQVTIESDIPNYKTLELRPYIRQQPNFKMFGLNKTRLQIYNLAGKDSTKRMNRFLKRVGEKPAIFDSTLVTKTTGELQKLFVNMGYTNVDVSSVTTIKDKKARVTYRIKGNTPYRIRHYSSVINDDSIRNLLTNVESLQRLPGEPASERVSLIKEGMLFDRNILDQERDRISNVLRNRGYFTFNKSYISYDATDSALVENQVDVKMRLDPFKELLPNGTYTDTLHRKYYLNHVYIYLDYDPLKISKLSDYIISDSIVNNRYTIYYQGKKPTIRPGTLLNGNFLVPQRLYSQLREDATYSSYTALNALSNIHIQYDEFLRNDTALLNAYILTMPTKKQSVGYSIEGTNTAGNLGVASSINYTHRNLFRGAETFTFKVRGAYEAISGFKNPYWEIGGEASIHIPKFVFPSVNNLFSRRMQTSTELALSYNHQARPEYDRTLFSGGIRYIWQQRTPGSGQHQFDLLDIDYVYLPRIDSLFLNRLPLNAQYFGYSNQFIVGTGYSYTQTTFDPMRKQRNAHSLRLSFESAGNALYAANALLKAKKDEQGSYKLFNTYFAQFVKGDVDYARTIIIDHQNSIAWRIGGGIGFPYGNSDILPFEKRYYSGGANSVRAWQVRELGPGNFHSDSTDFYAQSGDMMLNANIEYRSRFFWKFEAAVFIDAGNIWTIKDYPGQEGGVFKFNSFYKQIAAGYGLGLRLDMDFFLLRLDCGWKAYNPALSGKESWAILHPNLRNNWAWHFAVGYPF